MPAPYLLDTDHCIAYLNPRDPRHGKISARIAAASPGDLHISVFTELELAEGPYHSPTPAARRAQQLGIDAFLLGLTVVPISSAIVQEFGRLRAELRRTGQMIGDFDTAIAATALAYGFTVVTHNTAHFARVVGLQLEDWC